MKNKQEAKREAYLRAAALVQEFADRLHKDSLESTRFFDALCEVADSLMDRGNKMKNNDPKTRSVLAKAA